MKEGRRKEEREDGMIGGSDERMREGRNEGMKGGKNEGGKGRVE